MISGDPDPAGPGEHGPAGHSWRYACQPDRIEVRGRLRGHDLFQGLPGANGTQDAVTHNGKHFQLLFDFFEAKGLSFFDNRFLSVIRAIKRLLYRPEYHPGDYFV